MITKEQILAIQSKSDFSNLLTSNSDCCVNCIDCVYCVNCADCINCFRCISCENCINCKFCLNCLFCTNCMYCNFKKFMVLNIQLSEEEYKTFIDNIQK